MSAKLMRDASYLLPDPGGEVVRQLLDEIDRLKAELESKDKAIKLLQGHCNALMDTEGKLAQWKKGHTAGQEAAGYYQKQADDMIRQLRKELSDENANFTEEIMNLERQLAEIKHEPETTQLHLMEEETTRKIWEKGCKKADSQLAEARAEVERLTLENRQMLQGMKWDNQLKAIARQEAAREILEWAAGPESYDEWVVMVRERFGLEGVRDEIHRTD